MLTIGEKIKLFRLRAGMSQFELEDAIEASNGSLSRIENNEVNPTKETIDKIAKALKLNKIEINDLLGIGELPVTEEEILEAKETVKTHFADLKNIAYLLDDKWYLITMSSGFKKMLNISDEEEKRMIGINIMELILNPDLPLYKRIDNEYYELFCKYVLSRKRDELLEFAHQQWVKELITEFEKFPIFKKLWPIIKDNPMEYFSNQSRTMYFNIDGKVVPMLYGREVLKNCPRFLLIEYIPESPLFKEGM